MNMGEAWVHSSAGLYNLLNVNARYNVNKNNKQDYNARKENNILDLHPLTIYAAQRGVGFDFGFIQNSQTENGDSYPPLPNTAKPTPWVAFDITDGLFETLSGLSTQTPIKKNFKKFTFRKTIPTQYIFEQHIINLIKDLKPDILNDKLMFIKESSAYLRQRYSNNKKTPVQVTADLFGVKFPYYFNLAENKGVKKGSLGFPTEHINKLNRSTDYKTARAATKTLPSSSEPNYMVSAKEAMGFLYDGFLEERINKLDNTLKNTDGYSQLIKEIAIGLRVFQASNQLQSSPLNTGSNGAGYSNAANPLVGKPYLKISIPPEEASPLPTWQLDSFSGQEYLIDNLMIPKSVFNTDDGTFKNPRKANWLGLQVPPPASKGAAEYTQGSIRLEAAASKPNKVEELNQGWFRLNAQQPIPDNSKGAGIKSYKHNYEITSDSKKHVIYDTDTLSSDTITASDLKKTDSKTLEPSTVVIHNSLNIPLVNINPLISDLLPNKFSTYFATAGGIDRINGSNFKDIIIGPNASNQHGTLRFDAGAGNDIVSPGRGGSIGLLGEGKDKLVIGLDSLFGQTIILDFDQKSDSIHIEEGIKHRIDKNNPSLCLFFPRDEDKDHYNTKSILLSSKSSQSWDDISIKTIK